MNRSIGVAALLWLGMGTAALAQGPALDESPALRFAELYQQPAGPRGLVFSERVRAAQGRTVRMVGYMVAQEAPLAGRFMLVPRPVRLSEHADGDADDLPPATVMVHLAPTQRDRVVPWQDGLVALTGRLEAGRVEEDDGRVSWLRLVLSEDAVIDPAPHVAGR